MVSPVWLPDLGFWLGLVVPDCGLASWSWFGYGHWSFLHPFSKCWSFILILKVQRTSMFCKSWLWDLEAAGGFWLGFGIVILIRIWSMVFDTIMIRILALYLDFEGTKNIHVLQVLIWASGDAEGSWLGFGILIFIWIWSLVFYRPMLWFFAFYHNFEGARNINVL